MALLNIAVVAQIFITFAPVLESLTVTRSCICFAAPPQLPSTIPRPIATVTVMLNFVCIQQGDMGFPWQLCAHPFVSSGPIPQAEVQLPDIVVFEACVVFVLILLLACSEEWVTVVASGFVFDLLLVVGSAGLVIWVSGIVFSCCWGGGGEGSQEPCRYGWVQDGWSGCDVA